MIKYNTTTNNLDPDAIFKTHLETKLNKLNRFIKDATTVVKINLSKVKKDYELNVVVVIDSLRPNMKQQTFVAKAINSNPYTAADEIEDTLITQITKAIDKYKN